MRQAGESCSTCLRIRAFLTVAAALIVAIYVQPGWAARLAGHMPGALTIGLAICGFGGAVFLIRLWTYWRGAS